jgi:hypothetical protein
MFFAWKIDAAGQRGSRRCAVSLSHELAGRNREADIFPQRLAEELRAADFFIAGVGSRKSQPCE